MRRKELYKLDLSDLAEFSLFYFFCLILKGYVMFDVLDFIIKFIIFFGQVVVGLAALGGVILLVVAVWQIATDPDEAYED